MSAFIAAMYNRRLLSSLSYVKRAGDDKVHQSDCRKSTNEDGSDGRGHILLVPFPVWEGKLIF